MANASTSPQELLFRGRTTARTGEFTQEFLELYHDRLRLCAMIVMIYVPILFYLEAAYAWVSAPETDLWKFIIARGLLTAQGVLYWLVLRRNAVPVMLMRFMDYTLFVAICVCGTYIGVYLNGVDSPFFCGVIMMAFVRAFFVPGGLRGVVPVLIACWLSYPAQIAVMALSDPDVGVQLEDPALLSNVVLETLLILACSTTAAICAWLVGRLQRQAFRLRKFGRYEVEHKLGEGGMGVVYLAYHGILKRPVAIKLLRADGPVSEEDRRQFEEEAMNTARLSHPNTIQIFDFGVTDDGRLYYAMEFIEGLDLTGLWRVGAELPAGRVIHLAAQACRSLAHAHREGIIHRDIKPGNCIVSGPSAHPDFLKVVDFGLAKLLDSSAPRRNRDGGETAGAHKVKGTPAYMSPEQCRGVELDARSDIYSLGCVLYYMLCGRPVFDGIDPRGIMMAHTTTPPEPLSDLNPDVPEDLDAVVSRCLRKSPAERFQTANELLDALLACEDARNWTAHDANRWWSEAAEAINVMKMEEAATAAFSLAIETAMHVPVKASRRKPG